MSNSHSLSQKDLPIKLQILNISVNMARIANLVEGSKTDKSELIKKFVVQTESFLNDISSKDVSRDFRPTLKKFKEEFLKLKNQRVSDENKMLWSERALTWADILQIRSQLI